MSRTQDKSKKLMLSKVRSLQKNIGLKSSDGAVTSYQQNSLLLSKSEKKQMVAEAKQVKNKIGKFLQKIKNKANIIKQQDQNNQDINKNKQCPEQQSLTTDPYQFRKNQVIVLQKGVKKNNKFKNSILTSQYFNQQIGYKQPKLLEINKLHPNLSKIKLFNQSVETTYSENSSKIQILLSDFNIGSQLGAGKYGKVYFARHKKTGMAFALKKLNKKQINSLMVKQICHQLKIQMFINHPNIIKLYCYFHDKQSLYFLLQLSTSGHLYDLLQKKIFIQQITTKNIVKQICSGLCHLHKFNIIHRDIKLENILYQMGLVKICDFGWSIQTEDLRQTFCGTPLYIAPEILLQKGYDKKIDVWCVGILTFQLLYGRVPFQIRQQKDFLKIINEQVYFPIQPKTSKSAKNFIIQCLMKDPDERPNFDELLSHPFIQKTDQLRSSQFF